MHSKRKWSLLSCVDVRGKQLDCTFRGIGYNSCVVVEGKQLVFTLRGIGYYSPLWMQEESYSAALLEEMVITVLCGCERKTTYRKWVILSCVAARVKQHFYISYILWNAKEHQQTTMKLTKIELMLPSIKSLFI